MNSWGDWALLGGILYLILLFAFLFLWKRFWDMQHDKEEILYGEINHGKTEEKVQVPSRVVPTFKFSRAFKDEVNEANQDKL